MTGFLAPHGAAVVGIGTTRHGAHPGRGQYELAIDAVHLAMDDCGLALSDIDGLLTTQQFDRSGIDPIDMGQLLGLQPGVADSLGYSTAAFTIHYAALLVHSGMCSAVLCVAGRNPRGSLDHFSGALDYDPPLGFYNAAGTSALGWSMYAHRYRAGPEVLGHVAVAAREHARRTDFAAFRDPLNMADYLDQPYSIWPFRDLDTCRNTSGAVAVVVARSEVAVDTPHGGVRIEAMARLEQPGRLDQPEHLLCEGMTQVAETVYGRSGLRPQDVDVVGIYDGHTSAVVHTLENYGFCERGGAADFLASGAIRPGGSLPLNTDGGHLSGGYLVGWTHQVELVRQLRGQAANRQVQGAQVAQFMTTGGFREHFATTIYRRV